MAYIYLEKSTNMIVPKDGSIMGWRFFTTAPSTLTMMVMRPVTGTSDKFTLVGQNTVQPDHGRTTVVKIPWFARINAKQGDVIAWYYMKSSTDPPMKPAVM